MQICDEGALDLLAGIVRRAIMDWKNAKRNLRRRPYAENAVIHERAVKECEGFFRSAYFARMTGINGEAFIRMLREQEG
jgi:hypothetical protein